MDATREIAAALAADVRQELARYARERPEDAARVALFRELLEATADPISRTQLRPGHLTCSACVLDADAARVLLVHHAKLGRWLQPGGHVEPGDASAQAAARREVREECGLGELTLLARPDGAALVDVDIHPIPARGAEAAHLHYDLRYAFAAAAGAEPTRSDESLALRWVERTRLAELTREESVTRLVARAAARAGGR